MDGLSILLLRFAQRGVVKPCPCVVPSGESQMGSRHIIWVGESVERGAGNPRIINFSDGRVELNKVYS